jgi:hypothetical protein
MKSLATIKPEPNDPSLLYTYAMSAEKVRTCRCHGENTFREILRKNPNDVNSLNALRLLASRSKSQITRSIQASLLKRINSHLEMALSWTVLVGSIFVWVTMSIALEQLQQAFNIKPEADIAAHIGEVLWLMNRPNRC